MMRHQHETLPAWWRSRLNWALIGFLAIAGFFLFTEHRAHVASILSQLGIAPPILDAWTYGQERGAVDLGSSR